MKKLFTILFALLAFTGIAYASAIEPVSGSLVEKTEYSIPATGNSVDEYYTCSETLAEGQTIVVFYYSHESGVLMKVPFYFGPGGKNPLSTTKTEVDSKGDKIARIIANASSLTNGQGNPVIELYQPDNANATWTYVICPEAEAATVKAPDFAGGGSDDPQPIVPGQDVDNAILLTNSTAADFKSTNKRLYVKFVAEITGTATITMSEPTNYARWMEEGVMAYGQLKENVFANGNEIAVEAGKTYYCRYGFAAETEGTISYSIQAASEGSTRGTAILITANGTMDLLGTPHVGEDYFNKTTWFRIQKAGAFTGLDLLQVKIDGDNETEVALFIDDETNLFKRYSMGSGSGMLALNSTVQFDIDVAQHEYYIAISQDDINGTATFTVLNAAPGETMSKAFTAVEGQNTVEVAGWYKYTHTGGTKIIKLTNISNVYSQNGGNVAMGDDVKVGFTIGEGTSIYFQALTTGFTLTLSDIEPGMTTENPIVITNDEGATFQLGTSAATDAYRFMQYTATDDGTFIYATQNKKVLEFCNGATIRDITNPDAPKIVSVIQTKTDEFGDTYFIYKWTVTSGHTYLIEQGLGNNYGTVVFSTMFTPAAEGETIGKAIAINLYEAKDLGRTVTTTKYYKFTAPAAGDYTVSVQLTGYVKSYDADLNASNISRSYSDGLEYHNETFTLAEGETLIFSCQPSAVIEHIGVGINDSLIPNYYATITKADGESGIDYTHPAAISLKTEMPLGTSNVWYGPIAVTANDTLYIIANTDAKVNAIYFAEMTENNGLQWINNEDAIAVEHQDGKQIYTLKPTKTNREIQIMSYGMECTGSFMISLNDTITGIVEVAPLMDSNAAPKDIYTISGQKVEKVLPGRIYIINNRKQLIK